VELNAYEIAKYPVTVEEYTRFVEEGGREPVEWDKQVLYPNRPVVYVSWYDAVAYCAWARVKLPTEAQWERAARGQEGRRFPWPHGEPDANRANYRDTGIGAPTPVGLFPLGATPDGICDMAGNVWEWVSDWYAAYPKRKQRNPTGPEKGSDKVLRGGSWSNYALNLRAAYRVRYVPDYWYYNIGFRCARE
jgi:serine/threonine-protein kinase